MGQLRVISDHLQGYCFQVGESTTLLGRGKDCDVQLAHPSVSRNHCRISETDGKLQIVDLESKRGTCVNGVRIDKSDAEFGDKIRFGRVIVVYEEEAASSSSDDPWLPVGKRQSETKENTSRKQTSRPALNLDPPRPRSQSKTRRKSSEKKWSLEDHAAAKEREEAEAARMEAELESDDLAEDEESPDTSGRKPVNTAEEDARRRQLERRRRIAQIEGIPFHEDDDSPGSAAKTRKPGGLIRRLLDRRKAKRKTGPRARKTNPDWEERAEAEVGAVESESTTKESKSGPAVAKMKPGNDGTFPGPSVGLLSSFGQMRAMPAIIVSTVIIAAIAMMGKFAFDKMTKKLLIPVPSLAARAEKSRQGGTPSISTGFGIGDKVLGEAIKTFEKTIPKELR